MEEALSRTLWHPFPLPATPGPWAGSHSRTLTFPLHRQASHQDTPTHATVFTVGAQAANTARVSNEKAQDAALSFPSVFRRLPRSFDSTCNMKLFQIFPTFDFSINAHVNVSFYPKQVLYCQGQS